MPEGQKLPSGSFRERFHPQIWAALYPARLWFTKSPIRKGKGALYRYVLRPALPPEPASFVHTLGNGSDIELGYRNELGFKMLLYTDYEDADLKEACRHIEPGGTVLDVGGNIGVPAMYFAKAVGPEGRVLSFEPNAATAERYRANMVRNGFPNAEVKVTAVGSEVGDITFHESASSMLSSATVVPPNHSRSYTVPLTTLDEEWGAMGEPRVDLVKLDCEGGELAVLQGADRLLDACAPVVLLEAWTAQELAPMTALLRGKGYTKTQPEGFAHRNYLFVKKD